jgi:hypothetical protein
MGTPAAAAACSSASADASGEGACTEEDDADQLSALRAELRDDPCEAAECDGDKGSDSDDDTDPPCRAALAAACAGGRGARPAGRGWCDI